jgi:osmotically-inducible protein OsmY
MNQRAPHQHAPNQQDPRENRENAYRHRPEGEPQGRHDTALRGMGGSGYSYPDARQHGGTGLLRQSERNDDPSEGNGEYYGDARYGGTRDPLSTSSVGWGGEGGGFAGYTASRDRDATPLGGGVLGGDRMPRGIPDEARTDVRNQPRTDYRGRGPRSYRRSDARLYEDVNERLTADPELDADDITVEVSDGVVTLSGSVQARWMKHRAEDLVDSCRHVQDIHNHIRVMRSDGGGSSPTSEQKASPLDVAESTGGSAMAAAAADTRKSGSSH